MHPCSGYKTTVTKKRIRAPAHPPGFTSGEEGTLSSTNVPHLTERQVGLPMSLTIAKLIREGCASSCAINADAARDECQTTRSRASYKCPDPWRGSGTSATLDMLCAVDRLGARGSYQQRCEQVRGSVKFNKCYLYR